MVNATNAAVIKVLDNVIPMYAAMIFGWLVHYFGIIGKTGYDGLQQYLITLCLPFMVFTALISSNLYKADGMIVVCIAVQGAISFIIAIVYAILYRRFTKPGYRANPHFSAFVQLRWDIVTAVFCQMTFTNSLVVGVPIVVGMYGEQAKFPEVFIVVMQVVFIVPPAVSLFVITGAFRTKLKEGMLDSPKKIDDQQCIHDDQTPVDLERQGGDADLELVAATAERSIRSFPKECKIAINAPNINPGPCNAASQPIVTPTTSSSKHDFNKKVEMVSEIVKPLKLEVAVAQKNNETIVLLKMICFNPLIIASIIGIVFSLIAYGVNSDFKVPLMFLNIVKQFSNCVEAVALFQIGYFMFNSPLFPDRNIRLPLLVSLFTRFIISPVLMGALAFGFGLRKLEWDVLILQAALPLAIVPFALGTYYNIMGPLFSMSIVYGTILSLPVALIYYQLFQLCHYFYMTPLVGPS